MRIPAIMGMLTLALGACMEGPLYENKWFNPDNVWTWEEGFASEFTIEDTTTGYDLLLHIDHGRDYPYQNIYMKVSTGFPSDTTVSSILPVNMADKTGRWYGKCAGENCELAVFLQEGVKFRERGSYRLVFRQHTRSDSLAGIDALRFELKKHDEDE